MRKQKSTALYTHPFCRGYWRDAAAEMKDTKMLVIAALLTALRIALKPFTIYLAPQLGISLAMLANALGAMIFGPVVGIPASIISDTVGFVIYPTGDYFLPFMLTEIASCTIYALLLYRARLSALRVVISRFLICFLVNIVLQTLIFSWQYAYYGNPEAAKNQVLGIFTVARVFKNLAFFPLESIVVALFLKLLLPVVRRAGLIYDHESTLKFDRKQVVVLVCLFLVGTCSAMGYLTYRYNVEGKSRTADYTDAQRVEMNKSMKDILFEKTDDWDDENIVTVIDGAYREMFGKETDYVVSVYVVDEEAFAAGQAADDSYDMETLWGYSKSGPKKDKYHSLVKVADMRFTQNEKSEEITNFEAEPFVPEKKD